VPLSVNAERDSRLFAAAGSAGIGRAAAGAAVTAVEDRSLTEAYVADTAVDTSGTVDVTASSNSEVRQRTASGSGGDNVGIAGSALGGITSSTTQAYIVNTQLGRADKRASGVSVIASDRVLSEGLAGAVGLAFIGAGIGAGAAVTLADNTTSAYVENSQVYSQNELAV